MICPKCGAEYREGFVECADCCVPLEETHPKSDAAVPPPGSNAPPQYAPPVELVTVFRSGSEPALLVAESLLRSAGIDFLSRGHSVQELFGVGRVGGPNLVSGPVEIQVRAEDARDAAELLEHLATGEFDQEVGLEWEDE